MFFFLLKYLGFTFFNQAGTKKTTFVLLIKQTKATWFWKDMKVQQLEIFQEVSSLKNISISNETKKNNNTNYDYIANSQCSGLYSYGKLDLKI